MALADGHDCRRDDPKYRTVREWYRDHQGVVPIQLAQALGRLTSGGMSFADAYRSLLDSGAIILVDEERPR